MPSPAEYLRSMAHKFLFAFLLISVIGETECGALQRRRREEIDPCPKLEVKTRSGCKPCTLCNASDPPKHFHPACKDKNPGTIPHQNNMVLWCDNPYLTFPECPPIHETIVQSCSSACGSHGRQFAPGCECTVGCPGDSVVSVFCTDSLQWNNSNIRSQCDPPTTPASTTDTSPAESDSPTSAYGQSDSNDLFIILPIVILCLIGAATLVAVCLYFRKCKRCGSSNAPSAKGSDTSSGSDGTTDSLLGAKTNKHGEFISTSSHPTNSPNVDCPLHETTAMPGNVNCPLVPEHNQTREAAPSSHEEPLLMSAASQPATGTRPAQDKIGQSEISSQRALQDLVNDRQAVINLSKLFDRADGFDQVTWHSIAVDLLGWDPDTVRSREYLLVPTAGSTVPGDGPTYQVLKEAEEQRKGLIDLMKCLEKQKFRYRKAEDFLSEFFEEWKSKNETRAHC